MAVVAGVKIDVDARGASQALRQFQAQSTAAGRAAEQLQGATGKVGREMQTAANGMRFFIDAAGRARKENGQLVTTAEAAAAGLEKQGKAARNAAGALRGVGGAIASIGAAFSVIQGARFVFAKTAELETQTRSLTVLTGSAQRATQIIRELQQLGAVTPFTSTELIDAAKRLQAFGVEGDKVVETTRRLADVSGATGAELEGLVTAYGQVQAKGRLQGEELLQFQERGVALQQVLREQYGLTGEEFQKALEKGQISAQAVEVALLKLTDAGGKYANGAIAQSDTLAGRLSTLQDSIQNLAARLGTILAPAMQSILGLAIDIANQVNSVFETILLQRQLGANLPAAQRDRLFKQAGQEAEQIARLRGSGTIDPAVFTDLREQRFRDLMRTYGYQQGILTPPKTAAPTATPTLPKLGTGTAASTTRTGGRSGGAKDELAAIARLAYGPQIIAAAKAQGIDPRLLAGLVQVESGGNPRAVSRSGAIGLTQLMPGTARELGVNPRDPMQNLMGGARYLRQMISQFGSVEAGLRAYNQGPGNQQRFPGGVSGEARAYPGKVLAAAGRFGFGSQGMADATATAAEELARSVEAGNQLSTQYTRQIQLLSATSELERKRLQIQFDYQDRQAQINELKSAEQQTSLNASNEQLRQLELRQLDLEVIRDQLAAFEKIAGISFANTEGLGARAFRRAPADPTAGFGMGSLLAQTPAEQQMATYRAELDALTNPINMAVTGANAIGDAFGTAFQDIATGAKTTEQALADTFKAIGQAFISMAAQIIAKQLAMITFQTILKALGGGGGGLFSGAGPVQMPSGGGFAEGFSLPKLYAEGGFVTGPTNAVIGEGGEPEYVIPQSKMASAMARYSRGARGEAVIPSSGGGDAAAGGEAPLSAPIDVRYTVERINSVDYVTADQFQQGMARAAQQGAQRGEQATLRRLQQSSTTRRRIGI